MKTYRTSDMARVGGVHVNTVRQYEALGYLPPVPRNRTNQYRQFSEQHLDQMRVIRMALRVSWLGGEIGRMAIEVIRLGASGELSGALGRARDLAARVQAEHDQAEAAASALEAWATDPPPDSERTRLTIGQAADVLDVTVDMLHNWERDGLIRDVLRDPKNNYRLYGPPQIARLRVIRTLRKARYSTMSILRMLLHLDAGHTDGLREKLDTPDPGEDVYMATDYWLSTVTELVQVTRDLVAQVEHMVERSTGN